MLPRAWARALCLAPFVLQLFTVQTAHAASPIMPAAQHATSRSAVTQAAPSPTPTPSTAPDQTKPGASPNATSPANSGQQGPTTSQAPQTASTSSASSLKREVFGYATAGSLGDPSIGYPSWNFDLLSTVAFFSIKVQYDGQLVGDSDFAVWDSSTLAGLVSTAHAHGTKVVVTITGPSNPVDLCDALYNGKRQTIPQLLQQVTQKGVDGVNIDYEGQFGQCQNVVDPTLNASNQTLLTNFARDMRAALDAIKPGYYLTIASYSGSASANDGFFNIPNLNPYVDAFFVMAYDMDQANQPYAPLNCSSFCFAPVSPLANYYWNDTSSMTQYSALVGPGKVILGQPYYGRVGCVSSPADHATATGGAYAATYTGAAGVSSSPDVRPGTFATHRDDTDPNGLDRWDSWYDNSLGCWREMYWSDTTTLGVRYNFVNQMNLRGVGLWTLNYGGGSPELWTALSTYFKNCYSVDVRVQPVSPSPAGTAVTVTASAGCPDPNPVYRFSALAPGAGSYQLLQDYSTSPTFSWNTSGVTPGTWRFSVWTRDANSSGAYGNSSGTWDAYNNNALYNVISTACSSVSVSVSQVTPAAVGTAITLTAHAPGCANPLFHFGLLAPGAASYQLAQDYSTSPTFNWNTAGAIPGTYRISVWARDANSSGTYGNSFGRWDAYDNSNAYTLTSCSSLALSAVPPSTVGVGASVTITAKAVGCPNPNPLYQFYVLAPGATSYQTVQAYSPASTLTWSSAAHAPGTYRFAVWAKDASSGGADGNALGRWDVYNNDTVLTLTSCSALSVTVSPPSSAAAGSTVTVTAAASGCPDANPLYQFSVLAPGATSYQVLQAYSTNAKLTWTTTGLAKGTYRFSVWVRDANSSGAYGNSFGSWDAYNNDTSYSLT